MDLETILDHRGDLGITIYGEERLLEKCEYDGMPLDRVNSPPKTSQQEGIVSKTGCRIENGPGGSSNGSGDRLFVGKAPGTGSQIH